MPLDPTLWALTSQPFVLRNWPGEDEHLVFLEASGDLYLITSPAVTVLGRLASAPATAGGLSEADGLAIDGVAAVLATLDQIGLVRPSDS